MRIIYKENNSRYLMKIYKSDLFLLLIILFFFQPVLVNFLNIFKYLDELIVLFVFIIIYFKHDIYFLNHEAIYFLLLFSLIAIGLIGNLISDANQPVRAIIQDILSNLKYPLFSIAIPYISLSDLQKQRLSDGLSFFIRLLFFILFISAIISLFYDIGLSSGIRYGIKSFKFIYESPASLNAFYYLFMIIHSATLYKNNKLRKFSTLFTIIGIIPWCLTLRSRSFGFASLYIIIYVYLIYIRKKNQVYKFKIYHVIFFSFIMILLCWDAINKYFFESDKVARYLLLHTSIDISKNYFPVGSGFGTFGTEASREYYCNLYYKYGFDMIYGLNQETAKFITDQFWFAILAQFGVLGLIIEAIIIYKLLQRIWKVSNNNGVSNQIAAITYIFTYFFGSLTAPTFIQATIIPSTAVIYLLNNIRKSSKRTN